MVYSQKEKNTFYCAFLKKDPRYDGKVFIGVKTTGIYCRPICPAKPKKENVEFFATVMEAVCAGYRACLRCRPEAQPGSAAWLGTKATVGRALKLISRQRLQEIKEDEFANQLGMTARHLRRLFKEKVGRTAKQISDAQRLNLARKLILETNQSVTEIAFASGFQSVRRFNDAFRKKYLCPPRALRKKYE